MLFKEHLPSSTRNSQKANLPFQTWVLRTTLQINDIQDSGSHLTVLFPTQRNYAIVSEARNTLARQHFRIVTLQYPNQVTVFNHCTSTSNSPSAAFSQAATASQAPTL